MQVHVYIESEVNTRVLSVINIDSEIPLSALTVHSTTCRVRYFHIYKTVVYIPLLYRIGICRMVMLINFSLNNARDGRVNQLSTLCA